MCGIIGGFHRDRSPFFIETIRRGCARMQHRGPDDEGHFQADGCLIANRRLSILDIADGHQPMFSDDGRIAVVQNGEIYNFLELRSGLGCRTNCDTEVILRLYEREGEKFVERLNGMFAIAIFDMRARKLLLFRDRVGKKPLYYYDDGRRLLFASEIKSLLAMGVPAELDETALDAYLTYNFVPCPATMFRGIRHVEPGHMLTIDDRGVVEQRAWWRLDDSPIEDRSPDEWCDAILEVLRDAIRIRLRSDVPVGAFLSGGIDSSTVVRLMSDLRPEPFRTFTIGFDDPRFDESRYAALAAEHCGTRHICETVQPDMTAHWPLTVYHNDQPHGDVSFLPTWRVSRLARQHVTVVLTGDGGDELFAGYEVHRKFFSSGGGERADFESAYLDAISLMRPAEKQALYAPPLGRRLAGADPHSFARPHFAEFAAQDPVNRALGIDVRMLLPGNNLVKPDRMAMAVSLEPRAPFLDHRLVELAFRMPGNLKFRDGRTKWILKRMAERILPDSLVHRSKQMFTVPIGEWFKDRLTPLLHEVLLAGPFVDRGLFSPAEVQRLVEEHVSERANHTRVLRALVALEIWNRIFIDAAFDHAPTLEEIGITPPAAAQPRAA